MNHSPPHFPIWTYKAMWVFPFQILKYFRCSFRHSRKDFFGRPAFLWLAFTCAWSMILDRWFSSVRWICPTYMNLFNRMDVSTDWMSGLLELFSRVQLKFWPEPTSTEFKISVPGTLFFQDFPHIAPRWLIVLLQEYWCRILNSSKFQTHRARTVISYIYLFVSWFLVSAVFSSKPFGKVLSSFCILKRILSDTVPS